MAVKKRNDQKKRSPASPTARSPDGRKKNPRREQPESNEKISSDMKEIADLFKDLHFQKKILSGVDEMDVWRQLREVQKEYETLLRIRDEQNKALINERDAEIRKLKQRLMREKTARGESGE